MQARDINISARSLQDYELGKTAPSILLLDQIIQICNPPGGWDFLVGASARASALLAYLDDRDGTLGDRNEAADNIDSARPGSSVGRAPV